MADWSSLPLDLVQLIASKLPVIDDFAALSFVCRSYRSAVDKNQWRPEGCSGPPWLLLCCPGDRINGGEGGQVGDLPQSSERGFLNFYKNQKKFVMDLPEIHARRCWGSPYGWIVTLGLDQQLHLFNPLNRRRIPLPLPQTWWVKTRKWESEDEKSQSMRMVLIQRALVIKRPAPSNSSSTSVFDDNFVIVTISAEGETYVITPHSMQSVKLFSSDGREVETLMCDIAVHNGQIYIVGRYGSLFVFSGPDAPTAQQLITTDKQIHGTDKLYLVESLGELLVIVRIIEEYDDCEPHYRTIGFGALKFNKDAKQWIELDEDLGDCAIFVGDSQTISLAQPEKVGCRKNVIYFTDDNVEQFPDYGGGRDMGIFDFGTGTIEPLYEGPDMISPYSTPNWLIPSFT